MKTATIAFAFLVSLAFAVETLAAKNAKLKPALVSTGDVLLNEDFSGTTLGKHWQVNKGEWTVSEGVVTGREKAEDKHAGVLTCKVPNHDSAIRFSFKLGEATAFHLSFNKTRGHLFRIIVTRNGVILRTDKPGKKSKIAPVVLAKSGTKFEPGEWYTMQVEVSGERVVARTDNGAVVKGSHSSLDVDKPNYRFILRGRGLQLDDVMIWSAKR